METAYKFENNPELHVWDLEDYDKIDSKSRFENSWMKKYIQKDTAVLDLGCGPGYIVKILHDNKIKVLGIDLNEHSIQRALKEGLHVERMDALTAIEKYGDGYNFFLMNDFIEHIPLETVLNIIQSIGRKKNVRLFLATPNLDSLMGFKFWFHMPTHINAMHPFVIRQVLEKNGFLIEAEWSEYGNLPGKGWKIRLRKWLLQKLLGTQAQLFMGGANINFIARTK